MLAQDLPCFGGAQLAVDVTLRSPLTRNGEAQPRAAEEDGAILLQARVDKENKYPELLNGRCRLGGRRSSEAVDFIWQLAEAKAREVPSFISHQTAFVWERRWGKDAEHGVRCGVCGVFGGIIATSECPTEGDTPSWSEVLTP